SESAIHVELWRSMGTVLAAAREGQSVHSLRSCAFRFGHPEFSFCECAGRNYFSGRSSVHRRQRSGKFPLRDFRAPDRIRLGSWRRWPHLYSSSLWDVHRPETSLVLYRFYGRPALRQSHFPDECEHFGSVGKLSGWKSIPDISEQECPIPVVGQLFQSAVGFQTDTHEPVDAECSKTVWDGLAGYGELPRQQYDSFVGRKGIESRGLFGVGPVHAQWSCLFHVLDNKQHQPAAALQPSKSIPGSVLRQHERNG